MDTEMIELISKGVAAAAVAMALTWGTVEWALPVKRPTLKRILAVTLGLGAVFILQEAHFVHFGMEHVDASGETAGDGTCRPAAFVPVPAALRRRPRVVHLGLRNGRAMRRLGPGPAAIGPRIRRSASRAAPC